MSLPETGVRKPVTTLMFFLAVFVIGLVMFSYLSVDYLPEMDAPTITVMTSWDGASTEDVEKKVTKVIERALGSVNNLEEMTSTTRESISVVRCEFVWGTNLDEASNDGEVFEPATVRKAEVEEYRTDTEGEVENSSTLSTSVPSS